MYINHFPGHKVNLIATTAAQPAFLLPAPLPQLARPFICPIAPMLLASRGRPRRPPLSRPQGSHCSVFGASQRC